METVNFIERLLGTSNVLAVAFYLFWACVGIAISLFIHSTNRDPNSYTSPRKFSWSYLIRDNWKRVALDALLVIVALRFSYDLLGFQMSDFRALMIGVSFDKLGEYLQNKKILIGKS